MPIYFKNSSPTEPFTFDSIGNRWLQEHTSRPEGFPLYHYLLTESGCGEIEIQGRTYLLHEGEGVLIAPSVAHSYGRISDEDWITSFVTVTGCIESSIGTMIGGQSVIFTGKDQTEAISQIITEGISLFEHTPDDIRQLSILCYRFLLLFVDGAASSNLAEEPLYQQYVAPVIKEIETNFASRLTVEALSRSVYVTPQYLSRLFRRFLGCSTYEYLTTHRLNKAREYLLSTPYVDVQIVADRVGFEDVSHFIAMFRKKNGMTPLEFRMLFRSRH